MKLQPTNAANCRELAAECGRYINVYLARGQVRMALNEIEWARTLCLKALQFEQEEQVSAGVMTASNAGQAGGVPPPIPPAANRADGGNDIVMTHKDIRV